MSETPIVNLKMDTADVKNGIKALEAGLNGLGERLNQAFNKTNEGLQKTVDHLSQQNTVVQQLVNSYITLGRHQVTIAQQQTNAINVQTRTLGALIRQVTEAIQKQTATFAPLVKAHKDETAAVQETEKAVRKKRKEEEDANKAAQRETRKTAEEIKKLNGLVALAAKGWDYLKWTLQRVFYFGAILKFQEALGNVVKEGKEFEKTIASLTAVTEGSRELAMGGFQYFNDVADKIPFTFEEITKSALILNKTGLRPTSEMLEALGAIAVGTGQSMFTQATAVSSAMTGNLRGLRMLGVEAQFVDKTHKQLSLTFAGETQVINRNSAELEKYIQNLAKTPRYANVISTVMGGVTGKLQVLSNKWGEFSRTLYLVGGDNFIRDWADAAYRAVDTLIQTLKSDEMIAGVQSLSLAFSGIWETFAKAPEMMFAGFGEVLDLARSGLNSMGTTIDGFVTNGTGTIDQLSRAVYAVIRGFIAAVKIAASGAALLFLSAKNGLKNLFWGFLWGLGEIIKGWGSLLVAAIKTLVLNLSGALQYLPIIGDKFKSSMDSLELMGTSAIDKTVDSFFGRFKTYFTENADEVRFGVDAFSQDFSRIADGFNNELDEYDRKMEERVKAAKERLKTLETMKEGFDSFLNGKPSTSGKTEGDSAGGRGGSGAVKKLKSDTDEAAKAYERLRQEIERLKTAQLDAIDQENQKHQQRMEVLKSALDSMVITEQEYNVQTETLTQIHLEKLKSLYDQHYKDLAKQREEERKKQDEFYKDFSGSETDAMKPIEEFLKNLKKHQIDLGAVLTGNLDTSKYTSKQISAIYSSLTKAVSEYFGGMAQNLDESSGVYKAMFALQKSFAIASSLIAVYEAAAKALATTAFPANLIAWMQVLAQGMSIIGNIQSVNFAGAKDRGGFIPPGAVGLVGEIGPELVSGPAMVTSRRNTADLLENTNRENNITVNVIEDASKAGRVDRQDTEEETVIQICVANIRRGGDIADAISNTYGLARQGV